MTYPKRKKTVMKEFRLDEISAVDRPAQTGAVMTIMKRAAKGYGGPDGRMAMLADAEGHTHTIDIDEDGGNTSYVNGEGDDDFGHSHPWIRTMDGRVIIGAAKGHTHEFVEELTSKSEDGAPGATEDSNDPGSQTADSVGKVQEGRMSDTNDNKPADQIDPAVQKKLDEQAARAERAESIVALTKSQRDYFDGLESAEKQDEFLALGKKDADAVVAKAAEANAVVYTAKDGTEYRKSDDSRMVRLAKEMDEEKEKREKMEEKAKKADLEKRASELKHLPGDDAARIAILKGIDSLPEAEQGPALAALKAQDAQLGKAFDRQGSSDDGSSNSGLEAIAKKFRDSDPTLTHDQAIAKALSTPEGEQAYIESRGA